MILLLDNYDSFTYNLYQALVSLGAQVEVIRNDRMTVGGLEALQPTHVVLSPGPKTPVDAGVSIELILKLRGKIPILGVCLGHQAIAAAFGGRVVPAKKILHGKTSRIQHNSQGLFQNIPNPFEATRYHSLAVCEKTLPTCLRVVARAEDKEIMAIQHESEPIFGFQFHPESVLTKVGSPLLKNFLAWGSSDPALPSFPLPLSGTPHIPQSDRNR